MPKQLREAPECPPGLLYVWEFYQELASVERLTYQEVSCWADLMGVRLTYWEVQLIISLDRIFWRVFHD